MGIKKYKEFADKLFDSGIPKTEGALTLNAFDPKELRLFILLFQKYSPYFKYWCC